LLFVIITFIVVGLPSSPSAWPGRGPNRKHIKFYCANICGMSGTRTPRCDRSLCI